MVQASDRKEKSAATEVVTRLPFGKTAPLPGVLSISADGRIAAHVSADGEVVIWDAVKIRQLETIPADGKTASAVSLSADGNLVAIGYMDSRVILRSRLEKRLLREFFGHSGGITALALSPDGRMLASGGYDATTQLWDLATGRRLHIFDSMLNGDISRGSGIAVSIDFSGNGRALIVNEWYSRQYDVARSSTLWDIEDGVEISTRDGAPPNRDSAMRAGQALGGKGWLLAYTGEKGLMVERVDHCKPLLHFASGRYADTVAADKEGRWVAATAERKLTFFGLSGTKKAYAVALPDKVIALAAHPDGRSVFALLLTETQSNARGRIIIGRDAETVTGGTLYRVPVPAPLRQLPPMMVQEDAAHCPAAEATRLKQDFKLPEKPLRLPVIVTLVPTKAMTTDPGDRDGKQHQIGRPRELYFDQEGNIYAYYHANSSFRSGVAVWNPGENRLLRARFALGDSSPFRLREGWAGERWASGSATLQNLLTGKPIYKFKVGGKQEGYLVESDSSTGEIYRLAKTHFERYDSNGNRLPDLKPKGLVSAFAVRNGRLVAMYENHSVQVWQIQPPGESKSFRSLLKLETSSVMGGITMSADGQYLQVAVESNDSPVAYSTYRLDSAKRFTHDALLAPFPNRANRGVVQDNRTYRLAIWDFDKGEVIARLPRHRSRDTEGGYAQLLAAISDDGRLVASASHDGLVRVWNNDTRQLIGEGRVGGVVTAMAFDSAGQQLAAGRQDGQLFVFQVPEVK